MGLDFTILHVILVTLGCLFLGDRLAGKYFEYNRAKVGSAPPKPEQRESCLAEDSEKVYQEAVEVTSGLSRIETQLREMQISQGKYGERRHGERRGASHSL